MAHMVHTVAVAAASRACRVTAGTGVGRRRAVAILVSSVVLLSACRSSGDDDAGQDAVTTTAVPVTTSVPDDRPEPPAGGAGLELVPELVRRVEPSIVAILVARAGVQGGEGSGVIVRPDGVIVTNNHVVAGATDVTVALADGTQLPATVEATDPLSDLAILRVDRDDLPAVELADGYPEIGQLAVAVGNPLGFENTVTAGIISGLGRSIPASAAQGGQSLVDLVQTDAAISPGNSGGALIGPDGRLVGINVAYIPPAAGAVSLGFAIPAPTVRDVVEELLEDGTAEHAYMGVQLATVTPQAAEQLGLAVDSGAAVLSVEPGSPADVAGLQQGDVITSIDGEDVRDLPGLLTRLRRYDPGDAAELTVVGDDGEDRVPIEFADRPNS